MKLLTKTASYAVLAICVYFTGIMLSVVAYAMTMDNSGGLISVINRRETYITAAEGLPIDLALWAAWVWVRRKAFPRK